jgi:hypothetical protein
MSSCVAWYGKPRLIDNSKFIEQRFPDNKKAIIIIKNNEEANSATQFWKIWHRVDRIIDRIANFGIKYDEVGQSSLWVQVDNPPDDKRSNPYVWIKRLNAYQILMVRPGTYALKNIGMGSDKYYRRSLQFGSEIYNLETKEPSIASFTVKSGEVVYLGDVDLTARDPKGVKWYNADTNPQIVKISTFNEIESAKDAFAKKYPKLKDYKVITRMIKINEKYK